MTYFNRDHSQRKNAWADVNGKSYWLEGNGHASNEGLKSIGSFLTHFNWDHSQRKNAWADVNWNSYWLEGDGHASNEGLRDFGSFLTYFNWDHSQRKNAWADVNWNSYWLEGDGHAAAWGSRDFGSFVTYFDANHVQAKNGWRNFGRGWGWYDGAGHMQDVDLNHTWYSQLNQGAPQGCEGASLQIALSTVGRYANLQQIYDSTWYGYFGDPWHNFWGNPWGHGGSTTETVTAWRLADTTKWIYGGISDFTEANASQLIHELQLGHSVVTWANYYWDPWRSGGYHVMAIIGYKHGYFHISDPYSTTQREYWISVAEWEYVNSNTTASGWNLPRSMNQVVR